MSKTLIQLANESSNTVSAGSSIPLGGVVHKAGCDIRSGSTSVFINSAGYYLIDCGGSYTGTAGNAVLEIRQNGSIIDGATASQTVEASTTYNFSISTIVKVFCCAGATISAALDSTSTSTVTFDNVYLRVVKI